MWYYRFDVITLLTFCGEGIRGIVEDEMKIAWISSWPPRPCGIATYSMELVEALKASGSEVHIVCHTDGGSPGERNVYPVIDTGRIGWDERLYLAVKEINPDVVHIQHEYGLYQTHSDHAAGLFRPLFRWKVEGKYALVVTYHSVYRNLSDPIAWYTDLMQRLVDAGIVHELYQWVYLPGNIGRVVDNVYVIPHGTKADLTISKDDTKSLLGLSGKKVIGMIGWFIPTKGFHRVIKMWDKLTQELDPGTVMVVAGEARRGDPAQKEYRQKLLSLVEGCRKKERIKLVLGSFSSQEYDRVLASFDVMVMPYSFASQSGNLAHSLALGVPIIASGLEGLKAEIEASGAGIAVVPDSDEELARAIVTLVNNDALRKNYAQKATTYVREKISWSIVAGKHILLYEKLLAQKRVQRKDRISEVTLEP